MHIDTSAFAQTYAQARSQFLQAASRRGLTVESHAHTLRGFDGEDLAVDVALDGPADAKSLLLISSACHGVEGFCGSGVQVALLREPAWSAACADAGVAVLYVHALNPHGFSHWRRVTHEGVDLNRNFVDFSQGLPPNSGYDELADAVVPATWPPPPQAEARIAAFAAEHGPRVLQAAVSGGQYHHPGGLFYGGSAPTWSHSRLRDVLRNHAQRCARLAWIDLHTGLGPRGVGERIYAGRNDSNDIARARAWWGQGLTSIYDGSSSSALLQVLMCNSAYQECTQAEYTGMALEYGTYPLTEMVGALRADHWRAAHPDADPALRAQIRQATRDMFYIDTEEWKARILEQAWQTGLDALAGLAGRQK